MMRREAPHIQRVEYRMFTAKRRVAYDCLTNRAFLKLIKEAGCTIAEEAGEAVVTLPEGTREYPMMGTRAMADRTQLIMPNRKALEALYSRFSHTYTLRKFDPANYIHF